MPFTAPEWLAIIVALGALLTSIINFRKAKSETLKNTADASGSMSEAAVALIEPYRDEVRGLREELTRQSKEMIEIRVDLGKVREELSLYEEGTQILVGQLTGHGIKPLWKPPDWIG